MRGRCLLAFVTSPFTATRTCVTPQPRPERGSEGSHPTLDEQGTPRGPAQQPDITATGAAIMSWGSKRGGSQSTGSHFCLGAPGTECGGQTRGTAEPTEAGSVQILCQFFLGRGSRVNEAQAPAQAGQGFASGFLTSVYAISSRAWGSPLYPLIKAGGVGGRRLRRSKQQAIRSLRDTTPGGYLREGAGSRGAGLAP